MGGGARKSSIDHILVLKHIESHGKLEIPKFKKSPYPNLMIGIMGYFIMGIFI